MSSRLARFLRSPLGFKKGLSLRMWINFFSSLVQKKHFIPNVLIFVKSVIISKFFLNCSYPEKNQTTWSHRRQYLYSKTNLIMCDET